MSRRPLVLIISPDPVWRTRAEEALSKQCDVVVYTDLEDLNSDASLVGLDAARDVLVILDTEAATGDIPGAVTYLRAQFKSAKVVVAASAVYWRSVRAALAAGADDFIEKSLHAEIIRRSLHLPLSPAQPGELP